MGKTFLCQCKLTGKALKSGNFSRSIANGISFSGLGLEIYNSKYHIRLYDYKANDMKHLIALCKSQLCKSKFCCSQMVSLRSKRFRGATGEERGFRRFALAKNGSRAKEEEGGGGGEGRKGVCLQAFPSFFPHHHAPPSYFALDPFFARAKRRNQASKWWISKQ